jgi:hypothetical protein
MSLSHADQLAPSVGSRKRARVACERAVLEALARRRQARVEAARAERQALARAARIRELEEELKEELAKPEEESGRELVEAERDTIQLQQAPESSAGIGAENPLEEHAICAPRSPEVRREFEAQRASELREHNQFIAFAQANSRHHLRTGARNSEHLRRTRGTQHRRAPGSRPVRHPGSRRTTRACSPGAKDPPDGPSDIAAHRRPTERRAVR